MKPNAMPGRSNPFNPNATEQQLHEQVTEATEESRRLFVEALTPNPEAQNSWQLIHELLTDNLTPAERFAILCDNRPDEDPVPLILQMDLAAESSGSAEQSVEPDSRAKRLDNIIALLSEPAGDEKVEEASQDEATSPRFKSKF